MDMGKRFFIEAVKRQEKLTQREQEDLLDDMLTAFQMIRDPEDVVLFVRDLFTAAEVKHLSKRLRIAKLLLAGKTYEEIGKELHTSHGTVAKIGTWLQEKGQGFRRVIMKLPISGPKVDGVFANAFREWKSITHRYRGYFMPYLVFDELSKAARSQKNTRLANLLESVKEKRGMHEDIEAAYQRQKNLKKYSTT